MFRKRILPLMAVLALSLIITPWMHSQIKPFRLHLNMAFFHEVPTPIYLYHSTTPSQPAAYKIEAVDTLYVTEGPELPSPLALTRTVVQETHPITGLRIDPASMPNQLRIGYISVHTYSGSYRLSAEQLEPYVRAGNQIANTRLENDVLRFDTTGDDPNFIVPLPDAITHPPRTTVNLFYLLSWSMSAALVLFLLWLARRNRLCLTGHWRQPVSSLDGATMRNGLTGLALDLGSAALATYVLLQFVQIYTHFDLSPISHALDDDGVGLAVPYEVRQMKAIVRRQGHHAFVLADDMGKGDDESEIFQRATEYLYPSRIVHQSEWVFARDWWKPTPAFGTCKPVDKENSIVLYACRP